MRREKGRGNNGVVCGIALGGMSGLLLSNVLVFRTVFERPLKRWKKSGYDCALVCGCPANLNGSPSAVMKTRVEKAVKLWREGRVKKLFFSGGRVKNPHIESEVMKEYAIELGVPEEMIVTENRSVSTFHNMMQSRRIMEREGIRDCVVVTNGWHLRKANHYAQRFGLDYVMCAADEPKNAGLIDTLWRYVSVNLHMYFNFYRGLY